MATKPLKTIKFPTLPDTYTVPQVDATLSVNGGAADAKKTGDEIGALKEDLNGIKWSLAKSYTFTINNNKYIIDGALINGTVSNNLRASTDIISVFADKVLVCPKYGYTIAVGARTGLSWEYVDENITANTELDLSEYDAFFIRASNNVAITHTDNADIYIPAVEKILELSKSTSEIKSTVDYIAPIVAPTMYKITLENGTISNPNNTVAVRGKDTIPCKYGDAVTVYPVRPNEPGHYYSYGYRIYDANGNVVLNFPDVSPSANTVIISQSNAASIKFFWIETNGTDNNALRYETYGYIPYVIVESGTSIIERVENLYSLYGSLVEHYTITHDTTETGTLTYGDAHFMAVLPCAPNTRYHVKLSSAVTTHPRLWIAWADKYPERGGTVYNISEEDNATLDAYYTTGDTARFLVAYLGFTLASGDPTSKISITGDTYYQDPYARQYINDTHDLYRQSASVLKLKKTGDETYGQCDAKFIFMTDIHADERRLSDAVKRINVWGEEYISAVLNGGDTVYQKLPDGLEWYYSQIDALDIPVLPTVGNHDAWSALSVLETDPVVVYNAIIAPIVTSTGIVQPADAATNGYNYYYKDFNNTVRLVVLDCMYWNTTQLSWLESVLSNAKTNGLHVIALTHCAFPWANMQTVDCSWSKAGMLDGYSSQAAISDPSRTNIQAAQAVKDFIDAGGTFICWLTGHQHGDDVHILPDYGNQFVITLGSFAQRASMLQKSDIVTDYNYNCLTYITIDTHLKVIKFMRVGANIDMYGVEHNFLSIKYDETKLISAN